MKTAVLVILKGVNQTGAVRLPFDHGLTVGRDDSADLTIIDPVLSRRHFELARHADEWRIRDLGSLNGTKLNGQPIEVAALRDGDCIVAGVTSFRFELRQSNPSPHFTVAEPQQGAGSHNPRSTIVPEDFS